MIRAIVLSISILIICFGLAGCGQNELSPVVNPENDPELNFDYNYQVIEMDGNTFLIRNYLKMYEVYMKGTNETNVSQDIKFKITTTNVNLKAHYHIYKFEKDLAANPNPVAYTPVDGVRFGDYFSIKKNQLTDGKLIIVITATGHGSGVSTVQFDSYWNTLNKSIQRTVDIL